MKEGVWWRGALHTSLCWCRRAAGTCVVHSPRWEHAGLEDRSACATALDHLQGKITLEVTFSWHPPSHYPYTMTWSDQRQWKIVSLVSLCYNRTYNFNVPTFLSASSQIYMIYLHIWHIHQEKKWFSRNIKQNVCMFVLLYNYVVLIKLQLLIIQLLKWIQSSAVQKNKRRKKKIPCEAWERRQS